MTSDSPRAQLIHIETDRRLGHEWDEWDGKPLPGNGDFSAPPGVFFRYAGLTLALVAAGAAALIFVLAPRLAGGGAALAPRPVPAPPRAPPVPPRWSRRRGRALYGRGAPPARGRPARPAR